MNRLIAFSFLDPFLLLPLIGLGVLSLFITASTASSFFVNQLVFFVLGLVFYMVVSLVPLESWRRLAWAIYIGSLILLVLSYTGPEIRGATRWIDILGLRIQPSELVKPFFILVLSHWTALYKPEKLSSFVFIFALSVPVIVLVLRQPDLGNAIVYGITFATLMFVGGIAWLVIAAIGIFFAVLAPFFWNILHDYQRLRIMTFFNPHIDPQGAGYNALQAIIAIGSGQLFGMGLGHGTQSRLRFLPEYHTDFVFASIGEELGFVGVSLVLLLYIFLLGRILFITARIQDPYKRLTGTGIFALLFTHIFINTGMNIGIVPITGITLPLLSYGGSSILATCMIIGLAAAITGGVKRHPLVIR